MMMRRDVWIVEHAAGIGDYLADNALLGQQAERVVNRSLGDTPVRNIDQAIDVLGGQMRAAFKHQPRDQNPLGGGLDIVLTQQTHNIQCFTGFKYLLHMMLIVGDALEQVEYR